MTICWKAMRLARICLALSMTPHGHSWIPSKLRPGLTGWGMREWLTMRWPCLRAPSRLRKEHCFCNTMIFRLSEHPCTTWDSEGIQISVCWFRQIPFVWVLYFSIPVDVLIHCSLMCRWYCRWMHPCANLLAPSRRSQTSWGLQPAGSGQQHRVC